MITNQPFIYLSKEKSVNKAVDFNNESGVIYKRELGYHSIWAARVPFLPAMTSDDLTRMGTQRTNLIQQRQFRFIYDLARSKKHRSTFTLRFISTPNPREGHPNIVDMIFFGKVFSQDKHLSKILAQELWEKFLSNFPMEDPFGYSILPVTEEVEFNSYYQPIDFNKINENQLLEVRKYEDLPIKNPAILSRVERKGDYIAHPFVPSQDFNPMGRFFMALSNQPQKCYTDISIRPTKMYDQEIINVSFMVGQFKKTATEDDDVTEEYIRKRSQIGVYVYDNMMVEREQLFMIRVHLVGENKAPKSLAEALGSEMMGNAANRYPTQWSIVSPLNLDEEKIAINNIRYFEHDFWGKTIASPALKRLRYLSTATETYGAFRLPVPPESGYMPGILVRHEPFILPMDELELRETARSNYNDLNETSKQAIEEKKISIGKIYHRGNETLQEFLIPIKNITRHMLIGGSTGSGKSTTIKHMLSQLWEDYRIPFLVLYPIDKPDYRELLGFKNVYKDMLIFTIGDETTVPFRFNPFEIPDGVLIKTHISKLMSIFESAFSLHDPLPMIYREALRKVYRDLGWDILRDRGTSDKEYPIMSEFFSAIKNITENLNYGKEVQDNVKQASVIRIGDLLENAGHALNVKKSMSFEKLMNKPTILELGRIGSSDDISLIMGFLLIRLAEEIEKNPRNMNVPHITVVEEAHRLMPEMNISSDGKGGMVKGSGEFFGNLLAEVRGFGEGIIIAEQMPSLLIKGAIGNTFNKLMHWLEDDSSFELFSKIMNLSGEQKEYARTLKPGFCIIRSVFGKPIHVKIPEYGDQENFNPINSKKISDDEIIEFMDNQLSKFEFNDVHLTFWDQVISTKSNNLNQHELMKWYITSPMKTCISCLQKKTLTCVFSDEVNRLILDTKILNDKLFEIYMKLISNKMTIDEKKLHIKNMINILSNNYPDQDLFTLKGWLYCYIAKNLDKLMNKPENSQFKNNGLNILISFDKLIE